MEGLVRSHEDLAPRDSHYTRPIETNAVAVNIVEWAVNSPRSSKIWIIGSARTMQSAARGIVNTRVSRRARSRSAPSASCSSRAGMPGQAGQQDERGVHHEEIHWKVEEPKCIGEGGQAPLGQAGRDPPLDTDVDVVGHRGQREGKERWPQGPNLGDGLTSRRVEVRGPSLGRPQAPSEHQAESTQTDRAGEVRPERSALAPAGIRPGVPIGEAEPAEGQRAAR
jgi:hypothetical protein